MVLTPKNKQPKNLLLKMSTVKRGKHVTLETIETGIMTRSSEKEYLLTILHSILPETR